LKSSFTKHLAKIPLGITSPSAAAFRKVIDEDIEKSKPFLSIYPLLLPLLRSLVMIVVRSALTSFRLAALAAV
jgi:hypothetical protein